MATQPKPIPEDRSALTPYITVKNAAAAIDFYKDVFGATELMRMADPSGKVGHAELKIGNSVLMLSDEFPEYGVQSPETIGGTPVTLSLYVEDVDAVAAKATGAGAKVLRPVEDQFYGDRAGKFEDPFGHHWWLATHKEDVSAEEMKRRAADKYGMS
jgi:PhnB protein